MKWPFAKTEEARIEEFWKWFRVNSVKLATLEPEAAISEISRNLVKVDPGLVIGIYMQPNGPWTLEISPDGIREKITLVQRVVAGATACDGWVVVPFRQPANLEGVKITVGGNEVEVEQVRWVAHERQGDVVNLTLYVDVPANAPADADARVGFMFLDHLLGELVVMTRIGKLEFLRGEGPPMAKPLMVLPDYLDW